MIMSEKKQLNIDELEKVSGGVGEHVEIIPIIDQPQCPYAPNQQPFVNNHTAGSEEH